MKELIVFFLMSLQLGLTTLAAPGETRNEDLAVEYSFCAQAILQVYFMLYPKKKDPTHLEYLKSASDAFKNKAITLSDEKFVIDTMSKFLLEIINQGRTKSNKPLETILGAKECIQKAENGTFDVPLNQN